MSDTKSQLSAIEQQRLAELEQAFELFNQTSMQLTQAYEALRHQVADLQQQLEESDRERVKVAERLERLLTLLPAGVVVLNALGKIVEMNQSAKQILGEDAVGRLWEVVVRNVFLYATEAKELVKHDKTVYQLSEKTLDENQGAILLLQDVTASRELQAHKSRHQRLESLGEMAASLAHQIRTPLSSALLYLSQMASSTELDEEKRQRFIQKSLLSLRHLEALVNDMLQYAKGGRSCNKVIDLTYLLEMLSSGLEFSSQNEQVDLKFQIPQEEAGELKVLGDFDALMTAMQNLIMNAINVVKEGGVRIEVGIEQNKTGFIDLIVSDNGPGVEEALQEKIFEPFFTSRAKGTGLGLAVVRAVAEAHGGDAWVYSVPNNGARFVIRLPLYEKQMNQEDLFG